MRPRFASAAAGMLLAVVSAPANAQSSIKEQLIGSWSLVSLRATGPDGKITEPYGQQGKGILMFDGNGRFALVLVDPTIPKYASNNRARPTPEEAMAAAKGSFAFFGTYIVDEASKSLDFNIEASSYPNFNDTKQKRIIGSLTSTELHLITQASPGSSVRTDLVYRRD